MLEYITIRVDTPMGTQAPMETHLYIHDYQIKSTAFFNILSELHSSSSIDTSYLQGCIGILNCILLGEYHKQTNKV